MDNVRTKLFVWIYETNSLFEFFLIFLLENFCIQMYIGNWLKLDISYQYTFEDTFEFLKYVVNKSIIIKDGISWFGTAYNHFWLNKKL